MLSKTCIYAIKIMIFLVSATEGTDRKVSVAEICEGIGSPRPFTAKVLQRLTKGRMIDSTPGPGGGYFLREKTDYTLAEVMAALDEDYFLSACVLGFEECSEANPCPLHSRFVRARAEMHAVFREMTISEVAESVRRGETTLID
jgi:Rrf2 family protein